MIYRTGSQLFVSRHTKALNNGHQPDYDQCTPCYVKSGLSFNCGLPVAGDSVLLTLPGLTRRVLLCLVLITKSM